MYKEALELLLSLAAVVLYAGVTTLLAGLGLVFEYEIYLLLSSGELLVGLWTAAVGLIAFAAAYYLASDKLSQAVATLRE